MGPPKKSRCHWDGACHCQHADHWRRFRHKLQSKSLPNYWAMSRDEQSLWLRRRGARKTHTAHGLTVHFFGYTKYDQFGPKVLEQLAEMRDKDTAAYDKLWDQVRKRGYAKMTLHGLHLRVYFDTC